MTQGQTTQPPNGEVIKEYGYMEVTVGGDVATGLEVPSADVRFHRLFFKVPKGMSFYHRWRWVFYALLWRLRKKAAAWIMGVRPGDLDIVTSYMG